MSVTNGYTTVAVLKDRLDLDSARNDTMLEPLIEAASRQIDGMANRVFYSTAAEARYFNVEDPCFCRIDDCTSITEVASDLYRNGTYSVIWATTDYYTDPENAAAKGEPFTGLVTQPLSRYFFPHGLRTVKVTGDWGWSAVPSAIVEACNLLVIRLWKRKDAPFGIMGSQELGQLRAITKIDPDVAELVRPYARMDFLI